MLLVLWIPVLVRSDILQVTTGMFPRFRIPYVFEMFCFAGKSWVQGKILLTLNSSRLFIPVFPFCSFCSVLLFVTVKIFRLSLRFFKQRSFRFSKTWNVIKTQIDIIIKIIVIGKLHFFFSPLTRQRKELATYSPVAYTSFLLNLVVFIFFFLRLGSLLVYLVESDITW